MGILKGSCTIVRYAVEGELPSENFLGWVHDQLKEHAFKDIDETYEEISSGWVSSLDMLDSDFTTSPIFGDNVVFSLRIDQRKIPASTLKKFCLKEEKRIKEERQIPKLSRGQRLEIKENITLNLLKKMPPTTSVYDLYWDLSTNTIVLMTTNRVAQEVLEELFKFTFDLMVIRQIPFTDAERMLPAENQPALDALQPVSFA